MNILADQRDVPAQQIRLIPGVTAYWSPDKRGLSPVANTSSLPPTLPVNGATDSSRNTLASERLSADTQPDPETPVSKPLKEEWPSLSKLNIPRKKSVELPADDFKVASLSDQQVLSSQSQPVSPVPASKALVQTGVKPKEQVLPATPKPVEPAKEHENVKAVTVNKGVRKVDSAPTGPAELAKHSDASTALPRPTRDPPSAIMAPQNALSPRASVTPAALPLTPNVRMSPAPSGDPKMTIVVEGLTKHEPEDEVKRRFRAYGRIVSPL